MKSAGRDLAFFDLALAEIESAVGPAPGLFLGRLDAEALRRELDAAGILSGLAERGYPAVEIRTSCDGDEHRLRIVKPRGRLPLVDLRLSEATVFVREPLAAGRGLDVLSFLVVRWAGLQHPRGRFSRERPRLPGQRHPGLGLGRQVYARLMAWATAWGKDGLLNLPQYFHNAVFYAGLFHFLSPARQGGFEALRRDLSGLGVAAASRAIETGRVRSQGRAYRWQAGEMVAPIHPRLRTYLASPEYAAALEAARSAARYRFSPPQSSQGHRPRKRRKL